MVDIIATGNDARGIRAEIAKIQTQIKGLDENLKFFKEQLNGRPAIMLYSQQQIAGNPILKKEQKVVLPEVVGALARDGSYRDLLFTQIQPIIDKYETERRALDGLFPTFVFNEALIQTSGLNRTAPLFNPLVSVVEPVNPGQMFGGTGSDPSNENAQLTNELTQIAILLTGACQIGPPMSAPCQAARNALDASLLARYNAVGPTGLLVTQRTALLANPDLAAFASDPLTEVNNEIARIQAFQAALALIPISTPVPPVLLTLNQVAALARQAYIVPVRIPEMNQFLNVDPGYYNIRFMILRRRVADSGTVHEVAFYQDMINTQIPNEKADLRAQEAALQALL